MEVSGDNLNKCISTVVYYTFDLKPLQTLCLRTLASGQDLLACLPTGYREKFSLPVLAKFAFAVGQGRIPTMGRR